MWGQSAASGVVCVPFAAISAPGWWWHCSNCLQEDTLPASPLLAPLRRNQPVMLSNPLSWLWIRHWGAAEMKPQPNHLGGTQSCSLFPLRCSPPPPPSPWPSCSAPWHTPCCSPPSPSSSPPPRQPLLLPITFPSATVGARRVGQLPPSPLHRELRRCSSRLGEWLASKHPWA